jgi:hypothetical protein
MAFRYLLNQREPHTANLKDDLGMPSAAPNQFSILCNRGQFFGTTTSRLEFACSTRGPQIIRAAANGVVGTTQCGC